MQFPATLWATALGAICIPFVYSLPSTSSRLEARAASPPIAKTKNGTYVGASLPEYNQDVFLGIPYAQPPVGDLRFRNPQSLDTAFTGRRMAAAYSDECIGYGSDQWGYSISEDCLYLNVIRPAGTKPKSALPVAFWIHGGGFTGGGAPDLRYNLSFIVQNSVDIGTPMIAVSINYRLSAWGFLASGVVAGSGNTNMGLRDQRLAMHWVQENIAAFGGDPSKVTIWGESAGAESVGFHLTAYNGRDDGLFRGAIMESGNPVQSQPLYGAEHYDPLYNTIINSVGCESAYDTLACLRTIPYDVLNPVSNTTFGINGVWTPWIDGDFNQRFGSVQLSEGAFVHVPIITGANSDEGASFGPTGINIPAEFQAALEDGTIIPHTNLSSTIAAAILAAYPDDPGVGIPLTLNCTPPGEPYGAQYRRTSAFTAGIRAYSYRYNGWDKGLTAYSGVAHFQEVALVFDNINAVGYHLSPNPFANRRQALVNLAKLMSCTWASFIATGKINSLNIALLR